MIAPRHRSPSRSRGSHVALHVCCAPCVLEPLAELSGTHAVSLMYANPNIFPIDEYQRRLSALVHFVEDRGGHVIEIERDPARWGDVCGSPDMVKRERCRACYQVRLELTAREAAERGCDSLATTLTVSPYQDCWSIAEIGAAVARAHGLVWVGVDWRDRYPSAMRRARELGLYRQNYCGCVFSRAEARRAPVASSDAAV